MTLELLKVLVQPIILERDEDGKVIGEKVVGPVTFYNQQDLSEAFQKLQDDLETINKGG